MKDHVYKMIELVGSSTTTLEDAIKNAIQRAGMTLKQLRWFEVGDIRGDISESQVSHWQVTVKIGFTVQDENSAGKGV